MTKICKASITLNPDVDIFRYWQEQGCYFGALRGLTPYTK